MREAVLFVLGYIAKTAPGHDAELAQRHRDELEESFNDLRAALDSVMITGEKEGGEGFLVNSLLPVTLVPDGATEHPVIPTATAG